MFANKSVKKCIPYKLASHKVWEVGDSSSILKLDWNEATILPTPLVKRNLESYLNNGLFNLYPDVNNSILISKLASYARVNEENVQYFSSSDTAHEAIGKAFLSNGDTVMLLSPTYDNFRLVSEVSGAKCIHVGYGNSDDLSFDIDYISTQIKSVMPKMVYLCNPNNPTGTVIGPEIIQSLIVKYPEVLFLIDEAYFEFSRVTCSHLVSSYENILITRTFSKAFALANFRVGYLLSSISLMRSINIVRNAKNIPSFSQIAAISALDDLVYMESYVEEVIKAKDKFFKQFLNYNLLFDRIHEGAGNFILIELTSPEIKMKLISTLERSGIYIRDLSHSKLITNAVRITIGTVEQMDFVNRVISRFYNEEL